MIRLRLPALTLAALAFATAANALPRPGGPPSPGGPGGGLFISPCGEPFRGPDGLAAWFAGADADHDGALTLAEFRADAARFFKVLDVDSDGRIDGLENGLYETRVAPEITRMGFGDDEEGPPRAGGRGGGPGGEGMRGPPGGEGGGRHGPPRGGQGRGGAGREGAARFSLLNEPQPVRGADADLDWKVTAAEWAKAAGRRFALLDADGDSELTLAALPPLPGRRPARHAS